MRALDLCAGAGGLSLGLQWAGFDVLGIELDKDAHATHVANVGPCLNQDITQFTPTTTYDLVAGGVPCQSFSYAAINTRDGRSQLWRELIRIGYQAQAKIIVLENVHGLMTFDGGNVLRDILRHLSAAGYETTWRLLNAAQHGVPQRRKRLFVVGHRVPFAWPEPFPWDITVRQALGLVGTYEKGSVPWASKGGNMGQRKVDVDRPCITICGKNREFLWPASGNYRRMTNGECAAIQTFPHWFKWQGNSVQQQIANAVPPVLGMVLGEAIARALEGGS